MILGVIAALLLLAFIIYRIYKKNRAKIRKTVNIYKKRRFLKRRRYRRRKRRR